MAIDYLTIEKDFLTSSASIAALAKKYKCAASPLYRYARSHEWEKRRADTGRKRQERAIAKEISTQDEAWERTKSLMRQALDKEWAIILKDKDPHPTSVASLSRATKDARDMGAYGTTLSEKKMLREIENLERQLAEANGDKEQGIDIKIEGGDEYAS